MLRCPEAVKSFDVPRRNYVSVAPLTDSDWDVVSAIYAEGLETGQATFQTAVPTWAEWDAAHLVSCRLVARGADGKVLGWAALTPVSARPVYAGVAEVSIYIAASVRGRGIGRILLSAMVEASEDDGRWTLQASIFPENSVSLALHASCGFRVLGRRERVARHNGVWRDSLLLEKRSARVG